MQNFVKLFSGLTSIDPIFKKAVIKAIKIKDDTIKNIQKNNIANKVSN